MLLLASLLLLVSQDAGAPPVPSAEEVARVEQELDQALRGSDVKRIEAALQAAQLVPHPEVVRDVARCLADERKPVASAAVQALRWLEHPGALTALHREAKERKRMKTPEHAAAVLRAIGQHADPSSIPLLAHEPFEPHDFGCLRARLFGLGRIRTVESLEALLGILAVLGPDGRTRRLNQQMGDARIALMLLTGTDQGSSAEQWERWWRANKKGFVISADPPLLDKDLRLQWDSFWGLPMEYERDQRREDRGKAPGRSRG